MVIFLAQAPTCNRLPGRGKGCHSPALLMAQRWARRVYPKGYKQCEELFLLGQEGFVALNWFYLSGRKGLLPRHGLEVEIAVS